MRAPNARCILPARWRRSGGCCPRNEDALRAALDKIAAGAGDIESVLAALDTDTGDGGKAPPQRPASSKEPTTTARNEVPAGFGPASLRLLTDLAAFEVGSSTL